jgi:hypothetical protein
MKTASPFTQFGLLGHKIEIDTMSGSAYEADPVYLNTNAPWSALICGLPGSGKTHTLMCMLENCLVPRSKMDSNGLLTNPLSGIVFHHDNNSFSGVCEAAHLASAGIPVHVLVPPNNEARLRSAYMNIPGAPENIRISPIKLRAEHVTAERMMKLMAFGNNDGTGPLYKEVIAYNDPKVDLIFVH